MKNICIVCIDFLARRCNYVDNRFMEPKIKKSTRMALDPKLRKKRPEYHSLHFRPSEKDKTLIEKKIEKILKFLNSRLGPEQLRFKKNDIAIEALKRGLDMIEKENE